MKRQRRREGATKEVSLITSLTQSNLKILMRTRDFEKLFRGKAGMEIQLLVVARNCGRNCGREPSLTLVLDRDEIVRKFLSWKCQLQDMLGVRYLTKVLQVLISFISLCIMYVPVLSLWMTILQSLSQLGSDEIFCIQPITSSQNAHSGGGMNQVFYLKKARKFIHNKVIELNKVVQLCQRVL